MVYFDEYKISLSKTRSNSNDGYTAMTIVINEVTSSKSSNNLVLKPTKKKAGVYVFLLGCSRCNTDATRSLSFHFCRRIDRIPRSSPSSSV